MMEKKMVALLMLVMALGLLATTLNASHIDDITCGEAAPLLIPCIAYVQGLGPGQPSDACCIGANTVFQRANTTQNRRDLCRCIKEAAAKLGVNPDRAKQLPKFCNIGLSFPLDPNIDCNTVPIDAFKRVPYDINKKA